MFLRNCFDFFFPSRESQEKYVFSLDEAKLKPTNNKIDIIIDDEIKDDEIKKETPQLTWDSLPAEIIMYIASFLEIQDLCHLLQTNKQMHDVGLRALSDGAEINNVPLKGMSSGEIKRKLSKLVNEIKEKEQTEAKLDRLEHHCILSVNERTSASFSCAISIVCFVVGGFCGGLALLFHFSKADSLVDLASKLLIASETGGAIAFSCVGLAGISFFVKKKYAHIEKVMDTLRDKLKADSVISYQPK